MAFHKQNGNEFEQYNKISISNTAFCDISNPNFTHTALELVKVPSSAFIWDFLNTYFYSLMWANEKADCHPFCQGPPLLTELKQFIIFTDQTKKKRR